MAESVIQEDDDSQFYISFKQLRCYALGFITLNLILLCILLLLYVSNWNVIIFEVVCFATLLFEIFYIGHFLLLYSNMDVDTPRGVDLSLFFNVSCALQYFIVLEFYQETDTSAIALISVVGVMQLISGISVVLLY